MKRSKRNMVWTVSAGMLATLILSGCHRDMWTQPKLKAQGTSDFYLQQDQYRDWEGQSYGMASRPAVKNTVARGHLRQDEAFYTGMSNGKLLTTLPPGVKLTRELLDRGQDQYNTFCRPCHGLSGDGKGMIAQRGQWPKPVTSLQDQRLREIPIGHFYTVISNGLGIMYGYGSRIEPEDRWAVAAYVRVLQLSQNANANDLNDDDMDRLINPDKYKNGEGGHGAAH